MNKANNSEEPKAAPAYQNRVTLGGYLGGEPEQLKGRAVLSLATKTSWKPKDSDEWKSRTDWHRVTAWGQLAEAIRPLAQGDHIIVEGELRTGQYERAVPSQRRRHRDRRDEDLRDSRPCDPQAGDPTEVKPA